MASELHTLIEEELKNKNYKNDEEKALMGALRVEARVKEHQHQKKVLTLKRSICIGGGLLVVIVLWVILALKSKSASKASAGNAVVFGPSIAPASDVGSLGPAAGAPKPDASAASDEGADYQYDSPDKAELDEETKKNMMPHEPASASGEDSDSSNGPAGDEKESGAPSEAPGPSPVPSDQQTANAASVQEDTNAASVQEDTNATSGQEDMNATSGQEDTKDKSGQEDMNVTSGQEDTNATSGKEDTKTSGQEDASATSGMEDVKALPGEDDTNATPGHEDVEATPGGADTDAISGQEDTNAAGRRLA